MGYVNLQLDTNVSLNDPPQLEPDELVRAFWVCEEISYQKFKVRRRTACGYWIELDDGSLKWTSGRYASATVKEAIERLKARTRSSFRHRTLELQIALRRMRTLGISVAVPESGLWRIRDLRTALDELLSPFS
jgi:hypothetical protein